MAAGTTLAAQETRGVVDAPDNTIPVLRQSPLFGLGPQTLYRGGWVSRWKARGNP